MLCARCHVPATYVQQYGRFFCERCREYLAPVAPPVSPEDHARAEQARKLVNLSHIFGWGGLGVMLVGPILGAFAGSGTMAAILGGGGFVSAVAGAIIGQIGRGMQGRVI